MSGFERVVFDTSTLVSAALRVGSVPHQALTLALRVSEVCVSASALAELDEVLMRAKFDRYQPPQTRREFADFMRHRATWFAVSKAQVSKVNPPSRDPKDNQFLALAQICAAAALISSDSDLLVLHPWNGVPILTPAAFLQREGP
ncbi:MAG: putative toxin-antitoxin system toxin component, PIN family [Polaromonas sp.]|nr:putative toxin-antitoxin system toxin component, PIN family [Polaromonas sp.]